jgi:hypothetical protein
MSENREGATEVRDDRRPERDVDAAPQTTDPRRGRCIRVVLTSDQSLTAAAIEESNSRGAADVDHAWKNLAESLTRLDLADCPSTFLSAFSEYVIAISELANYREDRTGLAGIDDIFNSDNVAEVTAAHFARINAEFRIVEAIAGEFDVPTSGRVLTHDDS